jgi:hypothetical protein
MDPLQSARLKAIEWFKALSRSLTEIVLEEERIQLVSALERLASALYQVEQTKRALLVSMEGEMPDVYDRIASLQSSVATASRNLTEVALHLREQYRRQGIEIERELSETLSTRQGWASAAMYRWRDPELRPKLIEQGKLTLKALSSASAQLSMLIADLKALPPQ